MVDIGSVYDRISGRVHLTQDHYITWLSRDWSSLETLETVRRAGRHVEDLVPIAIRIFISFQAFYTYFKYRNMDRIRVSMDYEVWREALKEFLGDYPNYGRLDYIGDPDHAREVVARIESLYEQIRPSAEQEEASHRGAQIPQGVIDYLVAVDKKKKKERFRPAQGGSA